MRNSSGLLAISAALALAACAGTKATSKKDQGAAPGAGAGGASALGAPAASPTTEAGRTVSAEPDVRDMSVRAVPELETVHFPYDSDRLDEANRGVLRSNSEWLKSHADAKIQVSGHCDQRGTTAYNLALGQRRAAAVRDYYVSLGVDAGRVATISYGKERLLCSEMEESCWTRNRRSETLEAVEAKVAAP
jgi:peptidoglycan-associated lipoprotein